MRAHVTKLAAVAAMALGLALGGGMGVGSTPLCLSQWDTLDEGSGSCNTRARVIRLETDENGEQRAGYMVGRHFVGFLP